MDCHGPAERMEDLEDAYWSARARQAKQSAERPIPWEQAVAALNAADAEADLAGDDRGFPQEL